MKKEYDDDDGRPIADMSMLDHQSVLSGLAGLHSSKKRRERKLERAEQSQEQTGQQDLYDTESEEDKKRRRAFTLGATSAGLMIGLIYIAVFGIAILLMLLIWQVF